MGRIQVLSKEVINQIAAGEVVERPASVVKELVENALDAGATAVQITVKDSGRHIRIADNGCGMDGEDLKLAFCNHATSKISSAHDLFGVTTLGFRGEALASLASIAKVACISRPRASELGLKAVPDTQGQVTLSEAGCDYGTIFDIHDLFYNVPARLKFLKGARTELSHIQELVQQLAISHPAVRFELQLEQGRGFKTGGSGDLKQTIMDLYGVDRPEHLVEVRFEDGATGYSLTGFTTTPDVYRSSRKWVQWFVNGRATQSSILAKALQAAYEGLMTPGKFPVCALFLKLPLAEVDVNVHPTKKEVRFAQPNTVYSFVRAGLLETLMKTGQRVVVPVVPPLPSLSRLAEPAIPETSLHEPRQIRSAPHMTSAHVSRPPLPGLAAGPAPYQMPYPVSNQVVQQLYDPLEVAPSGHDQTQLLQSPDFRVIGQLAKTYILLETPNGLEVVDQHIAAERMHFERLMGLYEHRHLEGQRLLIPVSRPCLADAMHHARRQPGPVGWPGAGDNSGR
ncbi:MAG: DNA mismatch repair endonuclease MutL [Cyanobacteria bacterium HKST-UBA03]|nr:DNA mismatch repair endonuclease MutL [Cyanobacteria bacterium HKST-UBA03]